MRAAWSHIRSSLLLVTLLLSSSILPGQQVLTGSLHFESDGEPVVGATITAHSPDEQRMVAFTTTDAEGTFMLKSEAFPDTLFLSIRSIMTADTTLTLPADIGHIDLSLRGKVVSLKQVTIKAPSVRQEGDTLNYYVSAFADSSDRTIGDVIRKLPGVQVLPSGKILYQNKEISRFYIEGLDLLQGKYGVATNNLDASKVSTIQILENHQPIKVLKGMEVPENAAINLKLKESARGAFFATVQIGAGAPSFLLSNELVGMRFTHTQQNLIMYKGDNTGRDIADELTSFYNNPRVSDLSMFQPSSGSVPPVNKQHYLFNNSHVVSVNDLRMLRNEHTLTSNLSYVFDEDSSEKYSRQAFLVEGDAPLVIEENTSFRSTGQELSGTFTVEKNVKDFFLCNRLTFSAKRTRTRQEVQTLVPAIQYAMPGVVRVDDRFEYLQKKDNRTHRVQSDFSFVSACRTLSVDPFLYESFISADSGSVRQSLSYRQVKEDLHYRQYLDMGKGWYVGYKIGAFFSHFHVGSEMDNSSALSIDSLTNSLQRNILGINVEVGPGYQSKKIAMGLLMPFDVWLMQRRNDVTGFKNDKVYVLPRPAFYGEYRPSQRLTYRLDISQSRQFASIFQEMTGYLLTSYRNIQRSEGALPETTRTSAGFGIYYKNPFSTLFTSLSGSYSFFWRNVLNSMIYNGIACRSFVISYPHHADKWQTEFQVGKEVESLHSVAKLSCGYSKERSLALYQEKVSDCQSQAFTFSSSLNTKIGRYAVVNYTASYKYAQYKVRQMAMTPFHYLDESLSAAYNPVKGLTLTAVVNHYYHSFIEDNPSKYFANVGVKYKRKRMEYLFDWTNISGTNRFATITYNEVSNNYEVYHLRPSEVLFRIRISL